MGLPIWTGILRMIDEQIYEKDIQGGYANQEKRKGRKFESKE